MRPRSRGHRESVLERWCVRWAHEHKILVSKLTDPTGIPDRVFWVTGGRPWIIEFKDPGGVATELQEYYIKTLQQASYRAAVVCTKEHFLEIMNERPKRQRFYTSSEHD